VALAQRAGLGRAAQLDGVAAHAALLQRLQAAPKGVGAQHAHHQRAGRPAWRRPLDEMRKGEHKELGERFYKKLLTDRDASMAEVIVKKLAKSPGDCHFFAAGAAHLVH
jgi:hypothetical protein